MTARGILFCALLAWLASGVPAAAQVRDQPSPPPRDNATSVAGSASIVGTVVTDTEPARPVRRAIVTLNSTDRSVGRTVVTDDNGRFAFGGLAAGRYNVDASKRGWVTVLYGSKGPGRPGTAVALTDGQRATVSMRLPRGAVISGTILDDKGTPPPQVTVRVMRYMYASGERRLGPVNSQTTGPDERGQYRIFGLAAGDYYVIATPLGGPFRGNADLHFTSDVDVEQALQAVSEGRSTPIADVPQRSVAIAPVYYPGVSSAAQANQISLRAGEERSGVDFVLPYVASVHVDGSVTGLDGTPAAGATITLVNNDPNAGLLGFDAVRSARADANGHFSFAAVTPGVYVFSARTPTGWALSDVDVQGEDVSGLSAVLQESFSVSGTIRFEGAANAPPLSNVRVNLTPQVSGGGVVVSGGLGVNAEADGRFTIKGVSPGRYRLNAFLQGPRPLWTMRSSSLDGQDALDAFVDVRQGVSDGSVVFTDQLADLSGHAAPDSTVLVFSTNQAHWYPQSRRVLSARAAGDGSYTLRNLPPGEYFVASVDDVEPGQWNDPSYLQTLAPTAAKVTVAEGEKKTIDLR